MDLLDTFIGFWVGVIIGIFMSIALYEQIGLETHEKIINHKCGEYNRITGKFQWTK